MNRSHRVRGEGNSAGMVPGAIGDTFDTRGPKV